MNTDPIHRWIDTPPDRFFPILVVVILVSLAIGAGSFYWFLTKQQSNFTSLYNQLGIQLPSKIERVPAVQSRLEQLSRERCYVDAIVGLGRALLDLGYPREAANSLRSFSKGCGNVRDVLPWAHEALVRVSDYAGALEIANELVSVAPASGTFRYWRASAYYQLGDFSHALTDYMNSIQLVGDLRAESGEVFYKLSSYLRCAGQALRRNYPARDVHLIGSCE
jgi:tetratricopeptide (TPR) repeat protein